MIRDLPFEYVKKCKFIKQDQLLVMVVLLCPFLLLLFNLACRCRLVLAYHISSYTAASFLINMPGRM